ncbi:hypothetical protein ACTOWA_00155 [Herbaspirillum seropedicae]|uniref:hypothetical protein n=1 Tax=Herbaspirillum seropedicae TaxID=964 RepID=UPI002860BB80|nr:hypothetical protein [Herbaspirillum seropedicae]MDR6398000.1 hypothetical protein [Herbaspirillum seropedicae]
MSIEAQAADRAATAVAFEMLSLAATDMAKDGMAGPAMRREALEWVTGMTSKGISFVDCCRAIGAEPVLMRSAILGGRDHALQLMDDLRASAMRGLAEEAGHVAPERASRLKMK